MSEMWDPREDDNLGTMVCWHRRYNLGDVDLPGDPQEHIDTLGRERAVYLPLYLYDHNGLHMSTKNFLGKVGYWYGYFDSGQVGWISVGLDKIRHEFGWQRVTRARRERIAGYLRAEVDEYDDYLRS